MRLAMNYVTITSFIMLGASCLESLQIMRNRHDTVHFSTPSFFYPLLSPIGKDINGPMSLVDDLKEYVAAIKAGI